MPLGTDFLIPDKIAQLLDERSDLLIAPTVNYGSTEDLSGFPGTVSIGTEGLIQLLRAICDQLYRHGFRHFLILNGHGGNTAAMLFMGESVQLTNNGGVDHNDRELPDILYVGTYN